MDTIQITTTTSQTSEIVRVLLSFDRSRNNLLKLDMGVRIVMVADLDNVECTVSKASSSRPSVLVTIMPCHSSIFSLVVHHFLPYCDCKHLPMISGRQVI